MGCCYYVALLLPFVITPLLPFYSQISQQIHVANATSSCFACEDFDVKTMNFVKEKMGAKDDTPPQQQVAPLPTPPLRRDTISPISIPRLTCDDQNKNIAVALQEVEFKIRAAIQEPLRAVAVAGVAAADKEEGEGEGEGEGESEGEGEGESEGESEGEGESESESESEGGGVGEGEG